MLLFILGTSQAQTGNPEISSLRYDSLVCVSKQQGTRIINARFDTIKVDSSLYCNADTCYWTYLTRIDSTYDTTFSGSTSTFVVRMRFTLFEPHNDTCRTTGSVWHRILSNRDSLINDVFWGDTLTTPGQDKSVYCRITVSDYMISDYKHSIEFSLSAQQVHTGAQSAPSAFLINGATLSFLLPSASILRSQIPKTMKVHHAWMQGFLLHIVPDSRCNLQQILITNSIGQRVLSYSKLSSAETVLSLSSLPKGIYIVASLSPSSRWSERVIR